MGSVDLVGEADALVGMPDAQALVAAITDSARARGASAGTGRTRVVAVLGVAGSGKSATLAAIARALRGPCPTVHTDVPVDPEPGCAVVVDDIHLAGDATLAHLAAIADRGDVTVVVAGEARDRRSALRAVIEAVAARGAVTTLRPIAAAGIVARSGGRLPAGVAAVIAATTAGNRAAIDAALTAITDRYGPAAERSARMGPSPVPVGRPPAGVAQGLRPVAATARPGAQVPTPAVRPVDLTEPAVAAISSWFHQRLRRLDAATVDALAVAASGGGLDPDTVGAACDLDVESAGAAVDSARGSGLVADSDVFVAGARAALSAVVGEHRVQAIRRALVAVRLVRRTLSPDDAIAAAGEGVIDPDLAGVLLAWADGAHGARRVALLTAARDAGADPTAVDPILARAALAADDLDRAARLADAMVNEPTSIGAGVRIGAAVAVRRGTYSRAAQLYRWLGADRVGTDAAAGHVVMLAVGDVDGATEFADAARSIPPTTDHASAALVAQGMQASLGDSVEPAVGPLLRAVSLNADTEPESATVIATLLYLHVGDIGGARSVLARAQGAHATVPTRIRLLQAWLAMMAGDLADAAELCGSADVSVLRDRLSAHAIGAGIARRRGDPGAWAAAWHAAAPVVAEAEVDLFALLPLGELWLAAARAGELSRIAHLTADGDRLLAALNEPVIWSSAWHWYGVQAAILTGDPSALVPHAHALGVAAQTHPYAAVLADAGRVWLRVLQGGDASGPMTVNDVDSAARALHRAGHPFDGARLAAEAAMRIDDTHSATTLLQTARTIGADAAVTAASADGGVIAPLSDREAEVAVQLVLGRTYREIGATLFISAKTVEHHVARIRRRIGAGSRSEMLSMLRAAGYADR